MTLAKEQMKNHSLTGTLAKAKGKATFKGNFQQRCEICGIPFRLQYSTPCVCVCRTLFTAAIAAVMSTCDSVKTVLSGAVFTLINASAVLRTGQNGKVQEVLSTAVQIK